MLLASLGGVALLLALIWFALTRFPFGTRVRSVDARTAPRVTETIGEESATAGRPYDPGEIHELEPPPTLTTTASAAPPMTSTVTPTLPGAAVPEDPPPPAAEQPPTDPAPSREISADRAAERLSSYLRSTNYYRLPTDCMSLRSLGYRNVGYTFEVWSRGCEEADSRSELLGRWRVDARTEEVFRQRDDGRYLRP